LNFFRKPLNNTLWKIPTENSVVDSLCNWHDEQCSQFTDGMTEGFYRRKIPSVIPLVKITRHLFFLLCFKFFSHGNSVGKIPRKFTDENILSVFPFVFINFLVVKLDFSLLMNILLYILFLYYYWKFTIQFTFNEQNTKSFYYFFIDL
jgi:hypothetical protein